MTVGELIEKLQALDPSLPAWLHCGDPYDAHEIEEVSVDVMTNPYSFTVADYEHGPVQAAVVS